ncbi:hypothetical protein [Rubrivirga sp.]|uniref:hypothetical protein n=1 Tax=Rubrivirga sp. TaxID=1885344 RepID=UPI003B516741
MSRARAVSAVAFGGAAALVALGVVVALVLGGASADWRAYLVTPLLCALPVALLGATAGPMLAQAEGAGRAVALGALSAVAAVAVLVGLAFALMLVGELTGSRPTLGMFDWEEIPLLLVATLAAGAACSPVGGLCGYGVWRRLGHRPSASEVSS